MICATSQTPVVPSPLARALVSEDIGTAVFTMASRGVLALARVPVISADQPDGELFSDAYLAIKGNFVELNKRDVRTFYTWLKKLDASDALRAHPVVYPSILGDFGTIRVKESECTPRAEFYLDSNGHVSIDHYATDRYIEFSQAETILLLRWLDWIYTSDLL